MQFQNKFFAIIILMSCIPSIIHGADENPSTKFPDMQQLCLPGKFDIGTITSLQQVASNKPGINTFEATSTNEAYILITCHTDDREDYTTYTITYPDGTQLTAERTTKIYSHTTKRKEKCPESPVAWNTLTSNNSEHKTLQEPLFIKDYKRQFGRGTTTYIPNILHFARGTIFQGKSWQEYLPGCLLTGFQFGPGSSKVAYEDHQIIKFAQGSLQHPNTTLGAGTIAEQKHPRLPMTMTFAAGSHTTGQGALEGFQYVRFPDSTQALCKPGNYYTNMPHRPQPDGLKALLPSTARKVLEENLSTLTNNDD